MDRKGQVGAPKNQWGGPRPGSGRPKGSTNKRTQERAQVLDDAFHRLGGVEELVRWAQRDDRNRTEFYRIWSRIAPMQSVQDLVESVRVTIVPAGDGG